MEYRVTEDELERTREVVQGFPQQGAFLRWDAFLLRVLNLIADHKMARQRIKELEAREAGEEEKP